MTEEELKSTEVYKLAMHKTNDIWKEDSEKLRSDYEVWNQTHKIYGLIWKRFKECIPLMETPEFWEYPFEPIAKAAGMKRQEGEDKTIEYVLMVDIPFEKTSPSYGTIMKLLLNYRDILTKVWKDHYSKIVEAKVE